MPARDLPSGIDFGRFRFPDFGRFLPGPVFDQFVLVLFGPWETLRLDPKVSLVGVLLHLLGHCPRVGRGRNSFRVVASGDLI